MFRGFDRPVSISRIEARILQNVARIFPVTTAFEIGTGFGYSTLWIASGMRVCGKATWIGSLDAQTEGGLGAAGLEFAKAAARELGLNEIIDFFVGKSPQVVSEVIGQRKLDLVFIDGDHHGHQPVSDYLAVSPFLKREPLLVWHDIDRRYSVADGVARALEDGWSLFMLPTSCRMGVCYRTPRGFEVIDQAFNGAMASVRGQT